MPVKELLVYQKSINLGLSVYKVTNVFPETEKFGLISQMRRSAISISSNISEGYSRRSKKGFLYFLNISRGSLSELNTQVLYSYKLNFLSKQDFVLLEGKLAEVDKVLNGLVKSIIKPS